MKTRRKRSKLLTTAMCTAYLIRQSSCFMPAGVNFLNYRKPSNRKRKRKVPTLPPGSPTVTASVSNHNNELEDTEGIETLSIPKITWDHIGLMPASEIAYFYLSNTVGLSEETMWKITLEFPAVLGLAVKNLERKIDFLRKAMDLSDEDIRHIIGLQPSLLHLNVESNLSPSVTLLMENLQLKKSDLRVLVKSCPSILCYSIDDNLIYKLAFFLITLGTTPDEARNAFLKEPRLLTCSVETCLLPKFQFFHDDLLFPVDDIRSMVCKEPKILLYSLENNLCQKIVSYFMSMLHMDEVSVKRLLTTYPQVMNYSLHDSMIPVTRYFISDLGFSNDDFVRIILKYPRLFTLSLSKVKHMVGFFKYELALESASVRKIIHQSPQCLGLSIELNIQAKLRFLRTKLELKEDQLRQIITGMPTIFQCSIERNLDPKLDFLLDAFGGDVEKLKGTVMKLPSLLGYSLEKRIKPRMNFLLDIGEDAHGITGAVTLSAERFEEWLIGRRVKLAYERRKAEERKLAKEAREGERRKERIVKWTR
uniref:mTERF domain-containing protein, mitochondrial n=1 Tax=Leptocylindrus danicus TaxID=163516 RepID=A0A7S2L9C5_9STRA|mmetsp:Transcript_33677/g.48768  ORF Transcript_33677/g.48768 Transcript_33677/m.48768 type:complete len:535 (+) Transcript_33677:22-1626(+)